MNKLFFLLASLLPAGVASLPGGRATAAQPSGGAVVFTHGFNVYSMSKAGTGMRAVTTRGTGFQGIVYPWYAWSPDGRYLLLVRAHLNKSQGDLLLLDQQGRVLRNLASIPAPTDFWPSWAMDGDAIAFIAADRFDRAYEGFVHLVYRIDLSGRRTALFSYRSREGCGGGTSDPAQSMYWMETGFGGARPQMSWSLSRGIAVYSGSCGGGVNVTDLLTRKTVSHPRWIEPVLSPEGAMAVVTGSGANTFPYVSSVMLVNPRTGRTIKALGSGELPTWSGDGRFLYFVRRTPGAELRGKDGHGNPTFLQTYRSTIYRASGDGSGVKQLLSEDAYGFGALGVSGDNRFIVFSRVENDWEIWRHRRGNVLPLAKQYLPHVQVQRLDVGLRLVTVKPNAGQPVLQP